MANSRIPGPLEHDLHSTDADGGLSCDRGCHRGHTPGPIRVADASKDKPKKTTKAPPAATKIDTIIFHIYSPISGSFSAQDFIDWFKAPDDTRIPDVGKWYNEGINLEFYTDTKSGVKDFEKSLQKKGAIVVYIGHSTLTHPTTKNGSLGPSLGLTPQGKDQAEIPNATLRTLLGKSTASLVIIASCDSKTAVGKISTGPAVIAQNSGNNKVTWINKMANAVGTFLFLSIGWERDGRGQPSNPRKNGHATIAEALSASDADFEKEEDRFELAHGDGSVKLFP